MACLPIDVMLLRCLELYSEVISGGWNTETSNGAHKLGQGLQAVGVVPALQFSA